MAIVITNMEHHKKMLADAKENNNYENLMEQLRYLHEYGGLEDPSRFRIELGYDFAGYSVNWHRKVDATGEYVFFMNGGLICHETTNEWSVHT